MQDFSMQQNFPIASVIQAAQQNNVLQQQAKEAANQSLVAGLTSIGQLGQSIVARKRMMAQALAGAKMYASTPEGQAMLSPSTLTETQQFPVTPDQTAQGTDAQGNILSAPIPNSSQNFTPQTQPNQSVPSNSFPAAPVATRGQTTTTTTPSQVTPQDLVTAMMGESPSNMLTQLFDRQKQRQQFALDQQKEAFAEKMEPLKLAQQAALTSALTGVKSQGVSVENANNIRNQITSLRGKQAQAIKDFPELTGTFISGVLPAGSNAKETAAFNDYKDTQNQIDDYTNQLYSGNSSGGSKRKIGVSMQTPSGLTFTVNP